MSDTSDLDESTTTVQITSSNNKDLRSNNYSPTPSKSITNPDSVISRTTSPVSTATVESGLGPISSTASDSGIRLSSTENNNSRDSYDFIRSASKRKYFRDNLVQSPNKMTASFPEDGSNSNGNAGSTRSTLFKIPQPAITYTHGIQQQQRPDSQTDPAKVQSQASSQSNKISGPLDVKFVKDSEHVESPYQPTTTPLYTKLQFSSIEKFIGSSSTGEEEGINNDPEKGNQIPEYKLEYLPDDNIQEAFLAFLFSTFNIVFSVGVGYWHLKDGLNDIGYNTFVILIIAGLVMKISFLVNREIKVWRECKPIFILCLIPFFTAFALSFADFIFTIKQSKNKSYIRPWKNTRMVYFVESLILAFPQCVFQSVVLVEDPTSLITVKGMIILVGLGVLVSSMGFARIRYDSNDKPNRFGSGMDKIIRSVMVAGNKGLWVVTYICAITTCRLQFPTYQTASLIFTIIILLIIFEIPILFSTIRIFENFIARFTWMFFIIPQFVFLVALIYWVNIDPGLYETNVGVCLLGAASLFESIVLMGWLLDSCNDREMDIMPLYPHFFGDLWTCGKRKKLAAAAENY